MTEIVVKRRRLHPGQERLDASTARFKVAMFGRRWGKNVYGIDRAMRDALAGRQVGWFEPTYKYVLEAWRDLVFRLRPVAKSVSEQDKRIELITGGIVEMWSADTPDAGRGRSYDRVILNEAGIIRDLKALWQQAIRPTLADREGAAVFLGTPKGRTHDFSQLFAFAEQHAPEWEAFRGPTADNPFIPAAEIQAAKEELPPAVYAQEFEGIPADDGGNPFGLDAITRATIPENGWTATPSQAVCWGWDFARAQDWTVGIALDRDYQVCAVERWQLVPWPETKQRILRHTTGVAFGDSTGIGDPIVEDLQRMGCPIQGYHFSSKSKQQLMERLAGVLQQDMLAFPDGPIRQELEAFGYEYTASGVRYSAPDGLHDDCVMALALAVHARDQLGVFRVKQPEIVPVGVHPGLDEHGRRKKRLPSEPLSVDPRGTGGFVEVGL